MGREELQAAEASIEGGEAKIIISNPEVLRGARMLDFLRAVRPCHFAIDEAHCVSEWGESFRPAYLELGTVAEALDPPALSAFTATASPAVFEAVARILFGGSPYRIVEGYPDRPNIHYSVQHTLCREHSLVRLAREMPKPLIVFCSSREGAQMLARLLSERLGSPQVRFYHAGLLKAEKQSIEKWFLSSEEGILCSTCAYGLGVDKRNIRSVIHFQPPPSVESYLQEAGRAGRDGLPARAVLISNPGDEERLSREPDERRRSRYRAFLGYAGSAEGCRRDGLLDLLGTPREGRIPCSGCDRCEGGGRGLMEGEPEIRGFATANSRRYTREEALALLAGASASIAARAKPLCAFWGAFSEWDSRDAARCMDEALRLGVARIGKVWPWKGLLAAPRLTIPPSQGLLSPNRPYLSLLGPWARRAPRVAIAGMLGGRQIRHSVAQPK